MKTIIKYLLIAIFCLSCNDKQPGQDSLPASTRNGFQTVTTLPDSVMAFGFGSSSRPELALEKARFSAYSDIKGMSKGMIFQFTAANQHLVSRSEASSEDIDEHVHRWQSGDRHFALVITRTEFDSRLDSKPQLFISDTLYGNIPEKALIEMLTANLLELFPMAENLSGRYWISDLKFILPQDQELSLAIKLWFQSEIPPQFP